jgi:hypothetical protein
MSTPTGRTLSEKWDRFYMDGLDLSGYFRKIGPLSYDAAEVVEYAASDAVQGGLPGQAAVSPGTFNGIFDNTATVGLHAVASATTPVKRLVTVARGIRGEPVMGVPCFNCWANQLSYLSEEASGAAFVTMKFGNTDESTVIFAPQPWGVVLQAKGAVAALNASGTGVDDLIPPAITSVNGGYLVYHILSANGTATVKAQNSVDQVNGDYVDIAGATSGVVDASGAPVFGIAATAAGVTVLRYLRPQIVFGTATTVTYFSAFVRAQPTQ